MSLRREHGGKPEPDLRRPSGLSGPSAFWRMASARWEAGLGLRVVALGLGNERQVLHERGDVRIVRGPKRVLRAERARRYKRFGIAVFALEHGKGRRSC